MKQSLMTSVVGVVETIINDSGGWSGVVETIINNNDGWYS